MPTDFKGLLQSQHKPPTALRVSILVSDDEVEMSSELGLIGRWPSRNVSVERSAGNWFKLRLDEDEWDFRPDDPTGFFLAAPLPAPEAPRRRSRFENRTFGKVGKMALGAVLAVFLLSIGIVIGRYQLDGTGLALANMLVFAAALGAGWASIKTSERKATDRQERPGKSLRVTGNRTPLRVQDVLQSERRPSTATPPSTAASPSVSPPQTANGVRSEVQDSDGLMPEMAEGVSSIDPMTSDRLTVDGDTELPNSTEAGEPAQIGSGDLPRGASPQERLESDIEEPKPAAEQSTQTTLPTEAIKRYLASLHRLEADARSRQDDADTTTDFTGNHEDQTAPSAGRGIPLTEIRGIGPAISTALGELGVHDVYDLAELDSDDIDALREQLGHFGLRISSDAWVEQARHMVSGE